MKSDINIVRSRGEMRISQITFLFILAGLLVSCSQGSGSAPSPAPPESGGGGGTTPPVVESGESVFKYGEIQEASNGWVVQYDSSDSVETQTLANGWTAEVLYE